MISLPAPISPRSWRRMRAATSLSEGCTGTCDLRCGVVSFRRRMLAVDHWARRSPGLFLCGKASIGSAYTAGRACTGDQDDLTQRPRCHTKQGMSHVAEQLGDRFEALHKDGQRAVLEKRKTAVRGRNAKAKQLVNRLESCDEVSGVTCYRRSCPHAHNVFR